MVHHPSLLAVLGIAGELLTVDGHVVAAVEPGIHAQLLQRMDHGAAKYAQIQLRTLGIGDEGVVQVAQIMVHRTAAGKSAHHTDAVAADKGLVDLSQGVLVLADDDGIVILPQHQIHAVTGQTVEHILLRRQVEIGVGGGQKNVAQFHFSASKRRSAICL